TFSQISVNRPDLRFPIPKDLARRLTGRPIEAIDRRAKFLLMRFGGGDVLIGHLGMSGRMILDEGGRPKEVHDHLVFEIDDGGRLIYNDTRRFGFVDLARQDRLESHPRLAGLGPEPLSPAFNAAYFRKKLAGRMSPIKAVLLDQKTVSGIGNIYACEALYQAGISPRRMAASVGAGRAATLVDEVKDVLSRAIEAGGSSLRDYVQADGELGYFQHAWKVYGREGQGCSGAPGDKICRASIRRIVQSGRSTFYCHRCQR
ncbi:MAG: bifunctional DNA-formamidopyrimidine glycosylase/DNA-(apurinic or apyrimidinic site) lyase, partial [Pseudomonadota bacterium]